MSFISLSQKVAFPFNVQVIKAPYTSVPFNMPIRHGSIYIHAKVTGFNPYLLPQTHAPSCRRPKTEAERPVSKTNNSNNKFMCNNTS